jgi:hypothetical protein
VVVPGLVTLSETGSIHLTGSHDVHPDNHWGSAGMVGALVSLADSLHAEYNLRLFVNDMSLPLGGKFDLSAAYGPGGDHDEHRDGRSADVYTGGLTRAQINFLRLKWTRLSSHKKAIHDETATRNHFHFRF